MTIYQNDSNILVAIKRETTVGVAATTAGATEVRVIQSAGLELARAQIQSTEKRNDMTTPMGRLGGHSVGGSFTGEITIGGATDIGLEAIMRAVWVPAKAIPFASMTTVALGTNTVTASGGDWLVTQGVRVGDIFTFASTTVVADNGVNARVVSVTTLTITTTPAAFTTLVATATGTMTLLKKLSTATTPQRYSHTIEQYDQDVDLSELFLGCRLTGMKLSFKPGAMATVQYTYMALDRTQLTTGTSPWFTTPALTTGLALIADDSAIRYNGNNVATFTGFDLDFTIAAKGEPVIGSFVSPDVFDNDLVITGTITALRSDFSNLVLFDGETEFEVGILLQEPNTGPPKNCVSVFLPRVKISKLSAPVGGGDGAKIETLTLMVGPKVASTTTGYDGTVATIHSSAP